MLMLGPNRAPPKLKLPAFTDSSRHQESLAHKITKQLTQNMITVRQWPAAENTSFDTSLLSLGGAHPKLHPGAHNALHQPVLNQHCRFKHAGTSSYSHKKACRRGARHALGTGHNG
eukprot:1158203-Pelagomonas_calceolata.AAC.7